MGNARNHWKSSETSVATLLKGRGLEWPSTHQCSIQKIPFCDFMDGMKLSPRGQFTWSVFSFSFCSFFSQLDFFSLDQFFFPGKSFFITFFLAHPWPQVFFGKLLPTPTTYRPSSYQPPTSPHPAGPLPHSPPFALTSITRASDLERIWVAQSFKSTKYPRASRAGSFKSATRCQKLQRGGNRSAKARGVEVGAWR
jgi:hypothetical protein